MKFTPRQMKSCDMPNTKRQGVLSWFLAFMLVGMYWCLTCAGGGGGGGQNVDFAWRGQIRDTVG